VNKERITSGKERDKKGTILTREVLNKLSRVINRLFHHLLLNLSYVKNNCFPNP